MSIHGYKSTVSTTRLSAEGSCFVTSCSGLKEVFRFGHEYLQHQQDLYHVFIDFKKASDRVWREAFLATMKKYNISTNLIRIIKNLYDKTTSAVLFNSSVGDWFRTTVGVRR